MHQQSPIQPIRILLVEDEPLWQAAIRDLFQTSPRFELTALAEDFDSALQAFQQTAPQIVLLDWKIRGPKDGIEVGQALIEEGLPAERIILISSSNNSAIPPHPFLRVPKNRIHDDLLPLMINVTSD